MKVQNNSYYPVKSEFLGILSIGFGTLFLCAAVKKLIIARKDEIPASSYAKIGVGEIKEGVKRILPSTGVILTAYLLGIKFFKK